LKPAQILHLKAEDEAYVQQVARIENRRGHPYEFYQKLGFVIVGVLPDANGPGKPDILMAKRVQRTASTGP
jgi:hypothetical protein